ncbi:winged helix-turn-helix domain-containing protein [Alteromonas halophila]|uniref:OmpR/PhoB-type domain-containing protein n=1 Tax=Alteromonas halophila TaxID=516698 RepID=A0A918JFD4_9ALTE|nr:winged helix-turn-helix domain-containing protein [Alteromonas halophila]GGW76453.1 hypothetical protein GCM10007391_06360 [Alteromonas halophila]
MSISRSLAGLTYNSRTREVSTHVRHAPHLLSKQCGALFQQFLKAPDNTLTREEIRACLWGHNFVSEDTINHAVCRLRKSLARVPDSHHLYIETLPATGYRLQQSGARASKALPRKFRRPAVLIAAMLALL